MIEDVGATITEDERQRLAALADAILPRTGLMPGASDVGIAGALLDRVLRSSPSLAPAVRKALALSGRDPAATLQSLRAEEASAFAALMLAVVAAYYMSPEVRERIGYDGQPAAPIDVHELPAYLEDGTLERVIARGPLYLDVP